MGLLWHFLGLAYFVTVHQVTKANISWNGMHKPFCCNFTVYFLVHQFLNYLDIPIGCQMWSEFEEGSFTCPGYRSVDTLGSPGVEAWPKLVHTAIVSVSYSPDSAFYPNSDLSLCKSGIYKQQIQEFSDLSNGDWRVDPWLNLIVKLDSGQNRVNFTLKRGHGWSRVHWPTTIRQSKRFFWLALIYILNRGR